MRTATKTYVRIEPGDIRYDGKRELVEFLVTNWTIRDQDIMAQRDTKVRLDIENTNQRKILHTTHHTLQALVITFKRQPMYYVTSCFLPTFMLGILAYFTFYIDIADFNDRGGNGVHSFMITL